jgi:hypothetical protein
MVPRLVPLLYEKALLSALKNETGSPNASTATTSPGIKSLSLTSIKPQVGQAADAA